jgi:hypothetical protein
MGADPLTCRADSPTTDGQHQDRLDAADRGPLTGHRGAADCATADGHRGGWALPTSPRPPAEQPATAGALLTNPELSPGRTGWTGRRPTPS